MAGAVLQTPVGGIVWELSVSPDLLAKFENCIAAGMKRREAQESGREEGEKIKGGTCGYP